MIKKFELLAPLAVLLVAGCAGVPVSTPPSALAETASVASSTAQIFVYPSQAQSAAQLDRDRYECYLWAVKQTGFDPSQPSLAPHQRVEVVAAPGAETAVGAVAGAAIGAATSGPRHAAEGALAGAVIGGLLGAASETARAEEIRRQYSQTERERLVRLERQSSDYRRAISACLEGRGYTVK